MSAFFQVVEVNPNDAVGGGGCIVSEHKQTDCHGPYVVYFHNEMASNSSPHPVLCARHLKESYEAVYGDNPDVLRGGETGETFDAEEVEEIPEV